MAVLRTVKDGGPTVRLNSCGEIPPSALPSARYRNPDASPSPFAVFVLLQPSQSPTAFSTMGARTLNRAQIWRGLRITSLIWTQVLVSLLDFSLVVAHGIATRGGDVTANTGPALVPPMYAPPPIRAPARYHCFAANVWLPGSSRS